MTPDPFSDAAIVCLIFVGVYFAMQLWDAVVERMTRHY
jgi:hypothetical protein